MLIDTPKQLAVRKETLFRRTDAPLPTKVLMASPDHFDVVYSINPYMSDGSGNLRRIDRQKALAQWTALKDKYLSLGFEVEVIEAAPGFQDLVFTANQSLPFWDPTRGRPAVLMSRMRSEFRQGEVAILEQWYRRQGYEVHHLADATKGLEGNGDALIHPNLQLIWGGCGPRTDREVYAQVSDLTGKDVIVLPLQSPEFYHLDTCFSILDERTAVIQPEAFTEESRAMIRDVFERVIETTASDCSGFFTGNCHSPNGKDVLLHQGCQAFEASLKEAGYAVHSLDTSEFMKSGGSVFCMKMMCF